MTMYKHAFSFGVFQKCYEEVENISLYKLKIFVFVLFTSLLQQLKAQGSPVSPRVVAQQIEANIPSNDVIEKVNTYK